MEVLLYAARTGYNTNLCDNDTSTCELEKKSKRTLVIATVVPIAVATLLFVAAFLILRRMKNKQGNISLGNLLKTSKKLLFEFTEADSYMWYSF
jgi:hypothetical protein